MCSICGELNFSEPIDCNLTHRMNDTMKMKIKIAQTPKSPESTKLVKNRMPKWNAIVSTEPSEEMRSL
jgi:hypothetical protein